MSIVLEANLYWIDGDVGNNHLALHSQQIVLGFLAFKESLETLLLKNSNVSWEGKLTVGVNSHIPFLVRGEGHLWCICASPLPCQSWCGFLLGICSPVDTISALRLVFPGPDNGAM